MKKLFSVFKKNDAHVSEDAKPNGVSGIAAPNFDGKSYTECLDLHTKFELARFKEGTLNFFGPKLVQTTDIEKYEERLSEWCSELGLKIVRVDCRMFNAHSEFCNYINTLPTCDVVLLSHVTEIPAGPEQNNIGWAINSCKNGSFSRTSNNQPAFIIATCRPRRLCENYTDAATSGGVFAFIDYTNLTQIVEEDIGRFLQSVKCVFANERDLQMHLAIYLEKSGNYDSVEVEYYVPKEELTEGYIWDTEMKVDIVVSKDGIYVPIELKYKTKAISESSPVRFGESLSGAQITKNQAAQNLAKYDFWKDVRRLEILKKRFNNIYGGICLFLTNDESYINQPRENAKCRNFSMCPDTHGKEMSWEGDERQERPNFSLDKEYPIYWHETTISEVKFIYTTLRIGVL